MFLRERGGGVRMWVGKKSYRFHLQFWQILFCTFLGVYKTAGGMKR